MHLAGQQFSVLHGVSTEIADFDFETFSEAGYRWIDVPGHWKTYPKKAAAWIEPTKQLASLEGIASTKRGLSVVGVRNYVEHPTFEVLSLSYDLKDGNGMRFWKPPKDLRPIALCEVNPPPGHPLASSTDYGPYGDPRHPWDLLKHVWLKRLLEAWNVSFEFTAWEKFCVPVFGWPSLDPSQLRCCMAKAAINAYPRGLKNAGEVLHLVNQKDPAGEPLIRKLTVPKNPTKANPALRWTRETASEDFAKFDAYNVQDVLAESEASLKLPDQSPRELKIWQIDQVINQRGMQIDLAAVGNCIAIVEQATEKYNGELVEITSGIVRKSSEVEKTLQWLKTRGVYLSDLREETVTAELKRNHSPAVLRVLKIRQTLGSSSVKKLFAMRVQTCGDGRLRNQYAYASAHTHLWNSHDVQVANLYKGKLDKPEKVEEALAAIASRSLEYVEGLYGDAIETVADCLRSTVIAAPGKRLIASDFTAIQAVITSALAGEKWRLDVFHTHGKIYEAMASELTGRPLQFYIDYKKKHDKHHDDRQMYGKIPVLASDFGAWINGWKRFDDEGILGSDEQIKQLILKVRAKIPNIVELWGGQTRNKFRHDERPELYGLEGAAISAVRDRGQAYEYRGVRYECRHDILYCMPPGDNYSPLMYHEPQLTRSQREYASPWEQDLSYVGWNSNQTKGEGGWVRMPLYGGVLTQNIVAKIAREFQADALVGLEDAGYPVVLHTHDEQVTELPIGEGSAAGQLAIVNRGKPWAIDDWGRPWPIKAASADETFRYGKWGG